MTPEEARKVLAEADLIYGAGEVQAAIQRVAEGINGKLGEAFPLVLAVMGGATIFAGHLLPRLQFPLEFDYLHATRYGDASKGGEVAWIVQPRIPVVGRTVLVVDDILDEGLTLAAIRRRVLELGAAACLTAVFSDKDIGRTKPVIPDFCGLTLPNRFVFGFGMDVRGAWRNLPAIYAVKE